MKDRLQFPKLKARSILSPMAGITNIAFRELSKEYGVGMTYTEFVSSAALVRESRKTLDMVRISDIEKPVAVQLFGSNEDEVVKSGQILADKFDVIDVNCGCPAYKVIKTGAGSELLKEPDKISSFVNKLVTNINKPITVKIRSGIDSNSINAVEVAKKAVDAGASAVAIHGRTQKQGYSGEADWDIIKQVKEAVDVPVIGNGDVTTPEIFKKRIDESGVDYIMIARAAMGNPYLFKQINDYVETGEYDSKSKLDIFLDYLVKCQKYDIPFGVIKNNAPNFSKGYVGGGKLRQAIIACDTIEEIINVVNDFKEKVEK